VEGTGFLGFFLMICPLIIIGFIAYIKALVNAASHGKWAWFSLMFLFWPLFFFYYMGAYDSSYNGQEKS